MQNYACPPGEVCFKFKQNTFALSALCIIIGGLFFISYSNRARQKVIKIKIQQPQQQPLQQPDRVISYRRLGDPVEEPRRSYPFTTDIYTRNHQQPAGATINYPTRGATLEFQPIGTLTNTKSPATPNILQLFGRAIYPGSYKWQYYTNSDNFQSVKVQLVHKGRQCMDDTGCEELSTGDTVRVPAYNMFFRVELYNIDKPTYIPQLY